MAFSCDMCDKTYTGKSALNRHKNGVHFKISFRCPICRRTFARRYRLTRHVRGHLDRANDSGLELGCSPVRPQLSPSLNWKVGRTLERKIIAESCPGKRIKIHEEDLRSGNGIELSHAMDSAGNSTFGWVVANDDGWESSGDRSMYMDESERPDPSETGLWHKEESNEESLDTSSDNLQEPISPSETVFPSGSQSMDRSPSPVQVSSSVLPHVHVSPLVPHQRHSSSSSPLHLCPSARVLTPVAQNAQVSSSFPPVSLYTNGSLGHGVTRQVGLVPTPLQSVSLESGDSLFGRIVGGELATLPEGKQKELLKLKIQQLIFQTKFEALTTEPVDRI